MHRARSSSRLGKGPADEYTTIMEGCGDAARFALATTDQCTLVVRASQFEPEEQQSAPARAHSKAEQSLYCSIRSVAMPRDGMEAIRPVRRPHEFDAATIGALS
jgi:hypothetical protein